MKLLGRFLLFLLLACPLWTCGQAPDTYELKDDAGSAESLFLPPVTLWERGLAPSDHCAKGVQASFEVRGDTIKNVMISDFGTGDCKTAPKTRFFSLKSRANHCGSPVYEGNIDSIAAKLVVIDYSSYDCEWNQPDYMFSITEIKDGEVRRFTGGWQK